VLKEEKPYTNRPNAHLAPIDFDKAYAAFKEQFGERYKFRDFLSYELYPKVFEEYHVFKEHFGIIRKIPTVPFFYGLKENQEIFVTIEKGKTVTVKYLNKTEANEQGRRLVFFRLNGQTRAIEVQDKNVKLETVVHQKATASNHVGAPLQGSLSSILVKVGDQVKQNTPLFIIEAMKMESTITSPQAGTVKAIHLSERTFVEQDDLVVELE
jgi:pyruvate carboxylase